MGAAEWLSLLQRATPLLFSAPMVRAVVAGDKTVTRRLVEGIALDWLTTGFTPDFVALPGNHLSRYGYAGDAIYAKETFYAWGRWETRYSAKKGRDEWHFIDLTREAGKPYLYAADEGAELPRPRRSGITPAYWKRPAIFMPRHAARLLLEITGLRIERLQDITEAEALAEGVNPLLAHPRQMFANIWDALNGPGSWEANSWVWAIEFRRVT